MSRPERLVAPALLLSVPVAVLAVVLTNVSATADSTSAAGETTVLALPLLRAVSDAGAVLTIGLLVLAATILPPMPGQDPSLLTGTRLRATRMAAAAGATWVLAAVAVLVLTYAEVSGQALTSSGFADQLSVFIVDFDLGRSLFASAWLALLVSVGALLARGVTAVGFLAVLAMAALLPLALAGHSDAAVDHGTAVDTLAAHLVGLSVWVGGLGALLILSSRLGDGLRVAVARYSVLAGWAYGLVALSGLGAAYARLPGLSALASTYGLLIGLKVLALVALGWAGWRQRRSVQGSLAGGGSKALLTRLALTELAIMGVAIGLGVALSRTSPPVDPRAAPEADVTAELLGFPMPPPLTAARWVTQWQPDALWLFVAVLAMSLYVAAVRRLRTRGDRWPVGRTIAWTVGWLMFTWATSAGPGAYGTVLFSMHMVSHMTVAMAVPIFLVLGAPVTLAMRALPARRDGSRGPREWLLAAVHSRALQVVGHPLVAGAMFLGSLVLFYYTPLFELALRTHSGHVLMTLHFLVTGYLFASVICGIDPGPARPPHLFRFILLLAVMGFHAFFGVVMMDTSQILAENWFSALDRPWGRTLAEDQNRGGAMAWALGEYPIAIMIAAMGVSWIRSDSRESRRYDRQADRDGDAELAAYNQQLSRLAARETERR